MGTYYSKSVKDWQKKSLPDTSQAKLTHTIYLIGDAGDPSLQKQEPTLRLLQSSIEKDSNSSIIYLGDNIYHDGLPSESEPDREKSEKKINEQMDILKNYAGEIYFISGNHDWDYMGQDGIAQVKRQEDYVEGYLNRGNVFVPDGGCPGPFYTKLHNNIIMLAIDSQWWLHKYSKPYGRCGDCDAEDEHDLLLQFEDFIKNNRNKHIIVVAHHPLYSNGNHGGYYNILDHIFPLRLIRNHWFIPLPVIGSLYPLHRKFGGVDQDIPHYRYQDYKNKMVEIISKYDNIIYAAGHDHNLQYHQTDSINHIISGAGSKVNPVKGGDDALYTQKTKGFTTVKYYNNGEAWAEFWVPEGDGEKGTVTFRTLVYTRKTGSPESYCSLSAIDYGDSTVTIAPTDKYDVSKFKEFLMGNHYRKEWTTPVQIPLLDLKTEKEGLIPYGIGGGKQSVSLKLKNIDDKEYVLRSINKNPEKAVPLEFRNTFIHDMVEDQISAQHPYGALVIPKLSDAVKVYHTNPKLVLIPEDSCLGPYRDQFKNMMAIFEEDPDDNHEDAPHLGNSKNIVGTDKMRDELESDNDNRMDEKGFARARLLDMLIGDWDRHERQFRWATIENGDAKVYKVVPEDRDQAFFKFDGVIPYISSRKWTVRNLQNFEEDFDDIKGLNLSGRLLDRRFLSSLNRSDWKAIADSMSTELTDAKIETAVHDLPKEVFDLHGPEIIQKLKKRRDQLPSVANKYYSILSKYVDIYGSDKHEKFVVERINKNETKVTIYKINSEREVKDKIYERVFLTKETKEIRLYALGGEDQFNVSGKVNKGIKVRMIGGEGEDEFKDNSKVSGFIKKSVIYDNKEKTEVEVGSETNQELSPKETIHYPSQDQFTYNYFGPKIGMVFNPDDGLFIGGGFLFRKYKFRQNPYGAQHRLIVSQATRTGSIKIDYRGDIKSAISSFDLGIDFDMYTPVFVMNFFGYGNESVLKDTAIEYYRVRLQQINFNPSLNKTFTRFLTVGLGPKYQYFKLERQANTFLGESLPENSDLYSSRHYVGLRGFFILGTRDNENNPTRGILLTGETNLNKRIDNGGYYSQTISNFSFYITPNLPWQLTFAGRVGGAINTGDFAFYQANALGTNIGFGLSNGNLRGYRKTRFLGDASFYQNLEVRAQLFKFNTYIFPGKIGILAHLDNGRVWAKNENSTKWHTGYGAGLWIDIFHRIIVSGSYSLSTEDAVVNFRLGFFF
jgi:hypothetical protein